MGENSPPVFYDMDEITLNAYAKINLSLEVTGRRPDGYHDIRSLMQGIGLYDVVNISKCPRNGTKYNFPHCIAGDIVVYLCTDVRTIPTGRSNLAIRGIEAVLKELGRRHAAGTYQASAKAASDNGILDNPVQGDCIMTGLDPEKDVLVLRLDKRLPVAAGIAGGSGNASVSMLGLDAILGYPFSLRELMDIGAGVGADVPFSLMMNASRNADKLAGLAGLEEASPAAWMTGIGDIVQPCEPIVRHVIMANPGIQVSTKEAYEAIDSLQDYSASDAEGEPPLFVNDLERYTLEAYREAGDLKAWMEAELDADTVLMSGSGPTIAAYYTDEDRAKSDFARMNEKIREDERIRAWITITH